MVRGAFDDFCNALGLCVIIYFGCCNLREKLEHNLNGNAHQSACHTNAPYGYAGKPFKYAQWPKNQADKTLRFLPSAFALYSATSAFLSRSSGFCSDSGRQAATPALSVATEPAMALS